MLWIRELIQKEECLILFIYHGENLFHKAPMLEIGFESDYHGNNAYMKAQNNGVLQNFDFHL